MTRKERGRVVIDFMLGMAAKHGRRLSSGGGADGGTSTLVHHYVSWKAVISTWPNVEAEHEPNRVYMPHHLVVWALGYKVFSCDFDEDDLRILNCMRGPWDEMIYESVKRPFEFP